MKLVRSNSNLLPSVLSDFFDMDKFFEDMPSFGNGGRSWLPAVNVRENDNNYEIEMAVPGLKKEDFKVEVDGKQLSVSAEKETDKKEEKDNYLRREYSYDSFNRTFSLPDNSNEDSIESKYDNGILKLTVKKKTPGHQAGKKSVKVQ